MKVAIGVDIGGTNTVMGAVAQDGSIIAETSIPTQTGNDNIDNYIAAICKEVEEMVKNSPEKIEVAGIGFGAPNGNYYKGTVEEAPNMKWTGVVPFAEMVKKHLNYPVVVLTNDANAAAMGEMIYGAAKGMKNFVMITLGTGLGSGIVVNGDLVYGHDGFAGELGHTVIRREGRKCNCGLQGCLETYVSAPGIKRTVMELMAKYNGNTVLSTVDFDTLTSKDIFDAAVKGDAVANEAFEISGRLLGEALANFAVFSSPEAFILFGGLSQAGNLILDPAKKAMEKNMFPIFKNKIKVLPSKLKGAGAAVLGASALVWNELDK